MTRLTDRLAMEAEDIAAMIQDEATQILHELHAMGYETPEGQPIESLRARLRVAKRVRKTADESLAAKGWTEYADMPLTEFYKLPDRRDDITKSDSTYSFPPRTLTW